MRTNNGGKKHIAVNTQLIFMVIIFFCFVLITFVLALDGQIGLAILFGVLAMLPVFVFAVSPMYIVFDDNGVKMVYNFGQSVSVTWSEIREIYVRGSLFVKGDGLPRYVIVYPQTEKKPFFVVPEIPKTFRSKRLLKRYYKKDIK